MTRARVQAAARRFRSDESLAVRWSQLAQADRARKSRIEGDVAQAAGQRRRDRSAKWPPTLLNSKVMNIFKPIQNLFLFIGAHVPSYCCAVRCAALMVRSLFSSNMRASTHVASKWSWGLDATSNHTFSWFEFVVKALSAVEPRDATTSEGVSV